MGGAGLQACIPMLGSMGFSPGTQRLKRRKPQSNCSPKALLHPKSSLSGQTWLTDHL